MASHAEGDLFLCVWSKLVPGFGSLAASVLPPRIPAIADGKGHRAGSNGVLEFLACRVKRARGKWVMVLYIEGHPAAQLRGGWRLRLTRG